MIDNRPKHPKPGSDDVKGIRETFKEEWNGRTWYGKLWFPLWAAGRILFMALLFLVVVSLSPGGIIRPIDRWITKRVWAGISWVRGLTPEIHKDE